MDIVKENVDELNAVLKVKIGQPDYTDRYNTALKKYQKKVELPGFRPGKVPVDLVKKRFGKHILVEEINDLLSESLHKYITENKIDILGNPIPKDNRQVDFDNQTDFEFQYEVGLAPKINVELSAKEKFNYYTVKIDDALIDKNIDYIRRNYGQVVHPEVSEANDVLIGDFAEVDATGQVVPGGFFKTSLIAPEKLNSQDSKKKLTGLKKDDKVLLNDLAADGPYLFETLELPAEKLPGLTLQFTLKNLSRIQSAELNQELFDKIYGAGKVNSMDEFRQKVKEEIAVNFQSDSDRKFMNDVVEQLLKKANLTLPEQFLKKYLFLTNSGKATMEQVEQEFHSYSDSLRWQLLENHILKANQIAVTAEEAEAFVSNLVKMSYARRGMQTTEEKIKEQVGKLMADEKQMRNTYDRLYDQKLTELFKKTFTLENKELPHEEFIKLNGHSHQH